MPGPVTCLPGRERGPVHVVMPRSRVLHAPCRLLPLHRGLVLLGGCQVRGWGVEMGCFLGHLAGLKKRSYSRKRNELNPCHLPARCGGMSHTGLELRKDVPAERGHVGAQAGCRQAAGIALTRCCLAVCALCAPDPQTGSAEPCIAERARCVGHMLHLPGVARRRVLRACASQGSVCRVITPGQTFQLRNGSFCPGASQVVVLLGIPTWHAMHIRVPHAMHVPCPAQPLPGPAQAFGDGVTRLAKVKGFCYSSSPWRSISSKLWGQTQLGVLLCVLRGHLPT